MKTRTVFCNGCFDVLHVGHVRLLQYAKLHGTRLVVALNSDESVRRLKGAERPLVPLIERMEVIRALKPVDLVLSFHDDTPISLLISLRPDVYVLGPHYQNRTVPGAEFCGKLVFASWPVVHSTTALVDKIRRCS